MRSAPPSAGSWTRHVATAAALVTLLDERWTAWVQLGLFGIAAGLNSGWASRCLGRFWRLLKLAFFLGAAPVFLLLVDSTRLGEEWLLVRIVYYTLLAGMLALPLVEFDSVRDLRRTTWVLAACFSSRPPISNRARSRWLCWRRLLVCFTLFTPPTIPFVPHRPPAGRGAWPVSISC